MRARTMAGISMAVTTLAVGAAIALSAPGWQAALPGGSAAGVTDGAERRLPSGPESFRTEPARFTDPARLKKLGTAFPEVDRLITDFTARQHIPGAVWGIVIDGELAHLGSTGTRQVGAEAPIDGDTVFRIASMTKSFTAMAVMSLRDAGKLSLDDPVERYVPELRNLAYPTGDSPRITIRHLLSHATGFPEDNPWGDQQLAATEEEFSAMMRGGIPFSNPPGIAYEYSNFGFAILGRVVSNVAGTPYRQYIDSHILSPLGLDATTFEASEVDASRIAHGYRWEDETWKEEPPLPDGAFGCMGGMLTSMNDLARYVAAYLGAWPPGEEDPASPIRRASLREMQQAWRSSPAIVTEDASGAIELNSTAYGFGLRVTQTCDFDHSVSHTGGLPGFGSIMRWLPEYGVGFMAFGNRTYTSWNGVADQVYELLLKTGGLVPREIQPSRALVASRDDVSRLVVSWDDELADDIAAVNLFLDRSKDRRRAEFSRLREEMGACRAEEGFEFVQNALRGSWIMNCDKGRLRASVTLAPTMPPTVQYMEVRPLPPSGSPARRPTCPADRSR